MSWILVSMDVELACADTSRTYIEHHQQNCPLTWNGEAFNGGGGTEYYAEVNRRETQHRAEDYELWRGDSHREKCVGGGRKRKRMLSLNRGG